MIPVGLYFASKSVKHDVTLTQFPAIIGAKFFLFTCVKLMQLLVLRVIPIQARVKEKHSGTILEALSLLCKKLLAKRHLTSVDLV